MPVVSEWPELGAVQVVVLGPLVEVVLGRILAV
jgi:hypothetical protein